MHMKATNMDLTTTMCKILNKELYIVTSFILMRCVFVSQDRHLLRLPSVARHQENKQGKT